MGLTRKELKKIIAETFIKSAGEGIQIMQYCKGKGEAVLRTERNINLCDHPECKGCREIQEALEEYAEQFDKEYQKTIDKLLGKDDSSKS